MKQARGGSNEPIWWSSTALLLFLTGWWWPVPGEMPVNLPRFLDSEVQWEKITGSHPVVRFDNPDTLLRHQLYLLTDSTGGPLLYYADITTPVCIDNICKPVYIEMYWDLLGHYVGYGEFPGRPLTKYDHEPFLPEDHEKLHQLLMDRNSILDRKSLQDLYDLRGTAGEKIEYNGIEVDGVSGATKTEIKTSIVSGALYSCYRLWYLAHGAASAAIRDRLPEMYDESMAERFLTSADPEYRYYAVRQLNGEDFADFDPVFRVFSRGNPLVRKHILKKLPDTLLQQPRVYEPLYGSFAAWDVSTRTLLLERLHLAPAPIAIGAGALLDRLDEMTANQLRTYLATLDNFPEGIPLDLRRTLETAAASDSLTNAYILREYLRE